MLLSGDIQKNICSNDFTSLKKKYLCKLLEKKKKKPLLISFGQNFNKIWIFKVMFL